MAGNLTVELELNANKALASIGQFYANLSSLSAGAGSGAGKKLTDGINTESKNLKVGDIIKANLISGFAGNVVGGSIARLSDLIKQSFKSSLNFDAEISGIKALTGATADEINKVRELAMKLGRDTKFSSLEVAQAFGELLKAGLSLEQAMAGVTGALDLAAAGEIEVKDAAEIASTALNTFKNDNLSVGQAADILAGGANASATSVGQLKLGLSAVGPVTAAVGLSFRDTTTALSLFAQNGLKGSDAGTSLKTMFLNLQPQTKNQIALFKDLGLTTKDGANQFFTAQGKVKSLAEISGVLNTALKSQTDQQRLQTMETLFGSDAIRAANILYKEGAEGVKKMTSEMLKFTAADVAKEKMNNLKGSLDNFGSTVETLGIKIIGAFAPSMKNLVDTATNTLGKLDVAFSGVNFGEFGQKLIQLSPIIAGVVGTLATFSIITTVVGFFGTLGTAITVAGGVIGVFGLVLGFLTSPITLVAVGIGLLVGAGVYLYQNWQTLSTQFPILQKGLDLVKMALSGLWAGIQQLISIILPVLIPALSILMVTFGSIFTQISLGTITFGSILASLYGFVIGIISFGVSLIAFVGSAISSIASLVGVVISFGASVLGFIGGVVGAIFGFVGTVLSTIGAIVTGLNPITLAIIGVIALVTALYFAFQNNLFGIRDLANSVWATIVNIWNSQGQLVSQSWNKLLTDLSNTWNNFWTNVGNLLKTGWENIQNLWQIGQTTISSIQRSISDFLSNSWNVISSTIITIVGFILTTIQNNWNTILETISSISQNVQSTVQSAWDSLVNIITNAGNNAWNSVVNMGQNIISTLSGINLFDIGMNVMQGLLNGITSMIGSIASAISSVGSMISSMGSGGGGSGMVIAHQVDANAKGTRNYGGGWSMVGEEGPELMYIPKGSDVYSNPESEGMINKIMNATNPTISQGNTNMTNIQNQQRYENTSQTNYYNYASPNSGIGFLDTEALI